MSKSEQQFIVRDVAVADKYLLLEWANDPAVRANAFNSKKIRRKEHEAWFDHSIADNDKCYMLVAETPDGDGVGQVRFNRDADDVWYIDYSVASKWRGLGLGTSLLREAITRLVRKTGDVAIRAWVKADNVRSNSIFASLGFLSKERNPSGDTMFELSAAQEKSTIYIATPHSRHDELFERLAGTFPDLAFKRVRTKAELNVLAIAMADPSWIFFPHWSWIIPKKLYERYRCVIFHMTDLPYGRGGSPLQNLIVRGHKSTKLAAIACAAEIDAGGVYLKSDLDLSGTAEEILRRAGNVTVEMIEKIIRTEPLPAPQEGTPIIFQRRSRNDGNISRLTNLEDVYDYIRMLDADGYPKAFATLDNLVVEFFEAEAGDGYVEAKVLIRVRNDAE